MADGVRMTLSGGAALKAALAVPPIRHVDIVLGYGNEAVQYALIVHERLDVYHKPPTKAKYLEDPLNAASAGMDGRLATAVAGVPLAELVHALAAGLYREGQAIMAASQQQVPVRFGDLRRSGQVNEPVLS